MRKEDFTFVITTFKSENMIFKCLDNIPAESNKIIIENSGNYKLKSNLEDKYKNLECLVMESNLGFGKANNIGIRKCLTEYVFILNPDVILTNEKFNEILKKLKNETFSVAAPIDRSNKINFANKDFLEVNEVRGFAMILDLKNTKKILFDENIFLYLEEIDLCKRIRSENGRILILNTEVQHLGGASHGSKYNFEMEKSRNWHWMWSKFYYHKKHNSYLYGIIKTFPNLISSVLKFYIYKIIRRNEKKIIYKMRIMGLLNSYKLKKSFYRPFTE